MLIKKRPLSLSLALLAATASAQCNTKSQQQGWLDKAEACKPVIKKTIHHPVREVKIVADKDAFQGYKAIPSGNIADLYSTLFKQKKEIVVDFGEHLVDNVSFKIRPVWRQAGTFPNVRKGKKIIQGKTFKETKASF